MTTTTVVPWRDDMLDSKHGSKVAIKFVVIIPARYGATRFPGKPLANILGKPMILHVLAAVRTAGASRIIVATDHPQIAAVVTAADGEVCMTSPDHPSGTARLAEVVDRYRMADDTIIVNVQGDEPLIPAELIRQVAEVLAQSAAEVATLATPLQSAAELLDPNVVKVVTDRYGYALYFSRAAIPWDCRHLAVVGDTAADRAFDGSIQSVVRLGTTLTRGYQRHIGLYAYYAVFIRRYSRWAAAAIEEIEALEQLRILWHGEKIQIAAAAISAPRGVDTPKDLEQAAELLAVYQR